MKHAGWALLARHLAPRRRALAHVAGWSVVESLPALTSGLLVAAALDRGFVAGRPLVGLGWLGLAGLTLGVRAFATRQLFPWLAETVEPLRDALARDVAAAAITRAVDDGEIDTAGVARLTEHVESVRSLVSALLRTVRQFGFALLASLAGITALTPVVGLVVAAPLLVSVLLYAAVLGPFSVRQRASLLAGEVIAERAGQALTGVRDLVACGAQERAARDVGAVIEQGARTERALARVGTARGLVVAIGGQLPILAVLLATPWLIQSQRLSIGTVSGAITYLTTSLAPAWRTFVHVTSGWGAQLAVTLARLAEACAVGPAPARPTPARLARAARTLPDQPDLQVREVSFAYGPHAEPVVANLSLTLRPGEHLAVVGPSGVGKSTLANLLAGLLQPQRGHVRLGGVPLEDVGEAELRRVVALIPQESYVFAGTLLENLVYLRPDASASELDRAVDAVGLRPTVARLGGYGALVGPGGAELSAGERQLVALARVYVADTAIVLLDEATCYVDPVAEAVAEQAFAARGGILVVVAHRISSALRADRVLVMDGAAPLLGTHASLEARSALYADLVGNWRAGTDDLTGAVARAR